MTELDQAIYEPITKGRFRLTESVVVLLAYPFPEYYGAGPLEGLMVTVFGNLCIPSGFEWDGASGPTWDTESIRRAALVHDALYCIIRNRKDMLSARKNADKCFYHLLRVGGVNGFRRWYYYLAVRWFGKKAATNSLHFD